jgi:hypothetical protein
MTFHEKLNELCAVAGVTEQERDSITLAEFARRLSLAREAPRRTMPSVTEGLRRANDRLDRSLGDWRKR